MRPQIWSRRHGKQNVTGNFTYDFANGDALRLNSFYQILPIREIDTTNYTRFSTAAAITEIGKEVHVRDNGAGRTSLELGLEYEKKIGPGTLEALALASRGDTPQLDFRNRFVGAATFELNRTVSDQDLAEDIVRLSYSWPMFVGQTVELGVESAKNTLDQRLRTFQDLNGDGRIEEVPSPVAFAQVQEQRYEAFINHTWALTPKLSLESSFNAEFSKISTNYPANPDRQYTYPKPRIDARYTLSGQDQIRFKVERTVSQLAFVNFVPVYNVLDNRIDAGNPNLQPEKIWTYEGRYEHRLDGDNGVLEARAFYKDIADHIDRIVIGQTAAGVLIPASGNIDKATVYGAEGKASVRLALIGWRDVLITARYLKQHSEVSDPFSGRTREATGYRNWEFELGFRHDITAWALSYGASTVAWAPTVASDLLSFDNYDVRPTLEAFVEKGLPHRLSLRFEAQNLTHAHEIRDRLQYAPNVIAGTVSRIDYYNERRDMRFALRLRGKF